MNNNFDAHINTHQWQPCHQQVDLPQKHIDHASMQREQSLLPSDHHQRMHSPVRRLNDQLFRQVLFQASAERQRVQPGKGTETEALRNILDYLHVGAVTQSATCSPYWDKQSVTFTIHKQLNTKKGKGTTQFSRQQ